MRSSLLIFHSQHRRKELPFERQHGSTNGAGVNLSF
jgi:hypothetical protein